MRALRPVILLVWLLLALTPVLAACGGNAQPVIATFPPSATFTQVPVPPATQTLAAPPTDSSFPPPIPTVITPGPSPTGLVAPTLSPAPATLTATAVPTLAGLSVDYFTTDSEFVTPGENVTLFWSLNGADIARIFRVNADGERIYRWDVNVSGTLTVSTRTGDREVARFLLEGETRTGATVEQPLLIPLRCPEVWFFDPPPEDACPAAVPQASLQAEQVFEHGRMIWVEALDRIYIVFEDGLLPGWAQYPDDYTEGDADRDETLVPPTGLYQPIRGFGLIWRANARVQDRLGWATTPEVAFEGMFQSDSSEPSLATLYLRMLTGGIIALDSQTNEWITLYVE
ncbi:MAG: hypothetical protein JXQ72_07490 [Anaerolineae bacterium]|nr:hypothetical protein [Anaerolineae bacterium]